MQKQRLKDEQVENVQLVVFCLGAEEFGVEILKVQEIIAPQAITRVPRAPGFVEGVINLRGEIIPVVDLRKRFDLPVAAPTHASRIIIVAVRQERVGMLVDAVTEPITLPKTAIEPAPPLVGGVKATYLQGIGKIDSRLLVVLDLERTLSPEEVEELNNLEVN